MYGIPTYSDLDLDEYERARVAELSDSVDIRQALRDHDVAPGTLTLHEATENGAEELEGLVGVIEGERETMVLFADREDGIESVELYPMSEVNRISYDIDALEDWIQRQIDHMLEESDDDGVPDTEPDSNLGY